MSTAPFVPEANGLGLLDSFRTVRAAGSRTIVAASLTRMRRADGFSHSRALAFLLALLAVQGLFALVGLAGVLGQGAAVDVIARSIELGVPGPAGRTLIDAVTQGRELEPARSALPLAFGVVSSLVAGTTAIGQIERGLNRTYGIEQDRGSVLKYGRGFAFAVSAGLLGGTAFVLLALGESIGTSLHNPELDQMWRWARVPAGMVLLGIVVAVLFRWCPRRRQSVGGPTAIGSAIAAALATAVTGALGLFFRVSPAFGDAYGPLAGIIALLVWALAASISLFFGAAVAAEVESLAEVPARDDARPTDAHRRGPIRARLDRAAGAVHALAPNAPAERGDIR